MSSTGLVLPSSTKGRCLWMSGDIVGFESKTRSLRTSTAFTVKRSSVRHVHGHSRSTRPTAKISAWATQNARSVQCANAENRNDGLADGAVLRSIPQSDTRRRLRCAHRLDPARATISQSATTNLVHEPRRARNESPKKTEKRFFCLSEWRRARKDGLS